MKKFLITALVPLLYFLSLLFSVCPFAPTHGVERAIFSCLPTLTAPSVSEPLTPIRHTPSVLNTAPLQTNLSQTFLSTSTSALNLELPDAPFGSYACILTNDVYFYDTPDVRRGLFLLPKTYYVKLLEYGANVCKVEYLYDDTNTQKLIGYVLTEQLTFVDYIPKRPYLYYVFDVKYQIEDTQRSDSSFLTEVTVSCAYYGDYPIGAETYCYVLRGDTFGYVPKPLSLTYEENNEYADRLVAADTPDPSPSSDADSQTTSSPAQIAILITLCILVPVLAALILKSPKRLSFDPDDDS